MRRSNVTCFPLGISRKRLNGGLATDLDVAVSGAHWRSAIVHRLTIDASPASGATPLIRRLWRVNGTVLRLRGDPLAIAGLWRKWKEVDGSRTLAFTMLTANSDEHPL